MLLVTVGSAFLVVAAVIAFVRHRRSTPYLRSALRRAIRARDARATEPIMTELVERWHNGAHREGPISRFCGLSEDEYDRWTKSGIALTDTQAETESMVETISAYARHALLRDTVRHLVVWSAFKYGVGAVGNVDGETTGNVLWKGPEGRCVKCTLNVVGDQLFVQWWQGTTAPDGTVRAEPTVSPDAGGDAFVWLKGAAA
jgi:hypothetical protein